MLPILCGLLITYGIVQLASGWFEMRITHPSERLEKFAMSNNARPSQALSGLNSLLTQRKETHIATSASLSREEVLLALSELIEFSGKSPGIKEADDALRFDQRCQIPKIPIWPEGIKYQIWSSPKCVGPDPLQVFNGTIYFDEKKFSCNAIIFGTHSNTFIR